MYKFTNGIVVFDEKTRDKMIKAGYKLIENHKVNIVKMVEETENEESNTSSESISGFNKKSKKPTRKD